MMKRHRTVLAIMSSKPSVLICGGVNTFSRAIAEYLVPPQGEPLVSYLRIVDKFQIYPPTTYVGREFPKVLGSDIVDYQQINLIYAANVPKAFDVPEGRAPFSIVFDCAGETAFDRSNDHQRVNTAQVSYSLGLEAAKRKVAAYVRIQPPYYECPAEKTDKQAHTEKDKLKPEGVRGVWFHETLRLLAGIKDLNLAILRLGSVYGPRTLCAELTYCLILGAVYKKAQQEFKFLYPSNRINTVHTDDVVGAAWAVAEWTSKVEREERNKIAGEEIYFSIDKDFVKDLAGEPGSDVKLVAPLFNIVDDSDATQGEIAEIVAKIFGIKTGTYNLFLSALAKLSLNDVASEANEQHSKTWMQLLQEADPPIGWTPLTAYMEPHLFGKRAVAFSASKIKTTLGYTLRRPKVTQEAIQEVLDSYKTDGIWPSSA